MSPVPLYVSFLSVRDFGAVGNDSNDDSAAFASALSVAVAGGKALVVPAGIYRVNSLDLSSLTPASGYGIAIFGDGSRLSMIRGRSSTATPILNGNRSSIAALILRGLTFDSSPSATSTLPVVNLKKIENGIFDDLRVIGRSGVTGIKDDTGKYNAYTNILIEQCGGKGLEIASGTGIRGCGLRFDTNTGNDVDIDSGSTGCVLSVFPAMDASTTYSVAGATNSVLEELLTTLSWGTPTQSGSGLSADFEVDGQLKNGNGDDLKQSMLVEIQITLDPGRGETTNAKLDNKGTAPGTIKTTGLPKSTIVMLTTSNGQFGVKATRTAGVLGAFTAYLVCKATNGTDRFFRDTSSPATLNFPS